MPDTSVATDFVAAARDRARQFHCFLADQPHYLVPERLLSRSAGESGPEPLVVNPDVWFSWRDSPVPPTAAAERVPKSFLRDGGLMWVGDPVTGSHMPFWAGPWFQEKLAGFARGERAPGVSEHHRQILSQAGVLVRPKEVSGRVAAWKEKVLDLSARFERNGCVSFQDLIHPFHVGSLRRYYRSLIRRGGMTLGDSGSPQRYVAYNEQVAQFFHRQFTGLVSAIAGVRVKPTFAYVASYQGGAELPAHTDRAQCEYAISLLIDYTPEPVDQTPWSLNLETAKGLVRIWQGIGDSLVYKGCAISHYRTHLAAHATSTSMLFYYVPEDFAGSLA